MEFDNHNEPLSNEKNESDGLINDESENVNIEDELNNSENTKDTTNYIVEDIDITVKEKKNFIPMIILALVIIFGALGFVFKNEIIFAISPKSYLGLSVLNSAKSFSKNAKTTTSNLKNRNALSKILKNSFEVNLITDGEVFNLPNVKLFNDQNSQTLGFKTSFGDLNIFDFFMQEKNSTISIGDSHFKIINETFVSDYNNWLIKNKEDLEANMGANFQPIKNEMKISYTDMNKYFIDLANDIENPNSFKLQFENAFKKLLENSIVTNEKSTLLINEKEENIKKIYINVKSSDFNIFLDEIFQEQLKMSVFADNESDKTITLTTFKDSILEMMLSDNIEPLSFTLLKINDFENYGNDFSVSVNSPLSNNNFLIDYKNKSHDNTLDVNLSLSSNILVLGKANFNIDFSSETDNLSIILAELDVFGIPSPTTLDISGTLNFKDDEVSIYIDKLKSILLTQDVKIGLNIFAKPLSESISSPETDKLFFETPLQDIFMQLYILSTMMSPE